MYMICQSDVVLGPSFDGMMMVGFIRPMVTGERGWLLGGDSNPSLGGLVAAPPLPGI